MILQLMGAVALTLAFPVVVASVPPLRAAARTLSASAAVATTVAAVLPYHLAANLATVVVHLMPHSAASPVSATAALLQPATAHAARAPARNQSTCRQRGPLVQWTKTFRCLQVDLWQTFEVTAT